jgi:hypothetical protein
MSSPILIVQADSIGDDDSRSIATGSSISGQYPTTADSYHQGQSQSQTGFWDQSRIHSAQSPSEPHPFAFHKPPTPGSQPRPPPYDHHPSTSYLDPRPISHYTQHTIPPPPMRHAATDGEILRRRSNSLENLNRGMGSDLQPRPNSNYARSTHPPPTRPRTQTVTSELPPSIAALMVPGPMHAQPSSMQRFPSDHGLGQEDGRGAPTLPPPRGWTPEQRPNGLARGHTDPTRGGSNIKGLELECIVFDIAHVLFDSSTPRPPLLGFALHIRIIWAGTNAISNT